MSGSSMSRHGATEEWEAPVGGGEVAPQGDRPLPAPREAGLLGSSLRRRRPRPVGGVAPPRPQLFSFLFFCFLCTDEGLSSRVAERSSAVRGCRAALSHMVLFVCCLLRFFPSGCLSFLSRFYRSVIDTD